MVDAHYEGVPKEEGQHANKGLGQHVAPVERHSGGVEKGSRRPGEGGKDGPSYGVRASEFVHCKESALEGRV